MSEYKPRASYTYFEAIVDIDARIERLGQALKMTHAPKHAIGPAWNKLKKIRELQRQGVHQVVWTRDQTSTCSCGLVCESDTFVDHPGYRLIGEAGGE